MRLKGPYEVLLRDPESGCQWKVKAKKGYVINTKAKYLTELVIKDKPSWLIRFRRYWTEPSTTSAGLPRI